MKAVITFGRFNPVTTGHLKLFKEISEIPADKHYIYASHSQDPKKNPLPYGLKIMYIRALLKENPDIHAEVVESDAKNILDALHEINEEGVTEVAILVGDDRLDVFTALINKYNNHATKEGIIPYSFDKIDFISAGKRDANADDVTGMSASKMRQLILDKDEEGFINAAPFKDKHISQDMYEELSRVMLAPKAAKKSK